MSISLLKAFLPEAVVAIGAVVMLAGLAVRRSHRFAAGGAAFVLASASVLVGLQAAGPPESAGPLFVFDAYAFVFQAAIYASAAVIAVLAHGYLARRTSVPEEFYLLLLVAALGGAMVAASANFVSLFLSVETMSVAMYALIAYPIFSRRALEAGLKYLVLASVAGATLLFGAALIYFSTGTMSLPFAPPSMPAGADAVVWQAGMLFVLAGLAFKLGLVPLHMWTGDVYQGSAIPATAFVATVSKGAALAAVFRLFSGASSSSGVLAPLAAVAALSMIGGNLLALVQRDIKRLLGYSSIAHMGYLLVAVVFGGAVGAGASGFYFVAYALTMLVALVSLGALAEPQDESAPLTDPSRLSDVRGLSRSRPWLAVSLTLAMLSLAGLPLTVGFIGKIYLVVSGAQGQLWGLLGFLVAGSVIGLFYYANVIYAIFSPAEQEEKKGAGGAPVATRVMLVALGVALVVFGVAPETLLRLSGLLGR